MRTDPLRRACLLGVAALSLAPRAFAAANPAALVLYRSGAYLNAADAAAASGAPDDLVLAARALLAQVVVEPRREDALALIARAETLAQRALARQPDSVEARLHLAAAYGLRGRRLGPQAALQGGYVPRSRRLIDAALARAPREAWAYAMLGGWHLEVIRRGGAFGASAFHASESAGMAAFETARVLAPRDPVIPVQFGVSLLGLAPERELARARTLFAAAEALDPRDAFEAFIQRQAANIDRAARAGAAAAQTEADARFP